MWYRYSEVQTTAAYDCRRRENIVKHALPWQAGWSNGEPPAPKRIR